MNATDAGAATARRAAAGAEPADGVAGEVNETIRQLSERKSVRSFTDRDIADADRQLIIDSALQAPTAGNQILYTILHVRDQAIKDELAVLCDNQPFIASAPLVLIFLADHRRWLDAYTLAGAVPRAPGPGDLLLAIADALIAAQNAVVAAHSLGIGSCYIGDILEQGESVSRLLELDRYTVPAAMLVFGYPTDQQRDRPKPRRFDARYVVQTDRYTPLPATEIREMFSEQSGQADYSFDAVLKAFCERKYNSSFSVEMNRSTAWYLERFAGRP